MNHFVWFLYGWALIHLCKGDAFEPRTFCLSPLIVFTFNLLLFLVIKVEPLDPVGHITKIKSLVRPYFGCCILALIFRELQYEMSSRDMLKGCTSANEVAMAIVEMVSKVF